MAIKTMYRTEDGSTFDTKEEAEKHEYVSQVYDCAYQKFGSDYDDIRIGGITEFYEFIKFLQDNGVKV